MHNGERQIIPTLRALQPQLGGDTRLLLVLNGCVDGSAEAARAAVAWLSDGGADVRLLEAQRASRASALNVGEEHAAGHRLYLDQDAILSPDAVAEILLALDGGFHFVAPEARWRSSSPSVQAAMAAWNAAPYVREQIVTAGAYAVSEAGRARWRSWQEHVPDDKYARLHFEVTERRRARGTYEVEAPATFSRLVAARRRYRRWNAGLRHLAPEVSLRDSPKFRTLWRTPTANWGGLAVLAGAELLATAGVPP